jgi:hypothetical protein
MFDLEQHISEWRRQMLAVGIRTPVPLEELEAHLREEIARQIRLGADEPTAYRAAAAQIGEPAAVKMEFEKVQPGSWNRPMVIMAWSLFAVSFILPSYAEGWGWQCAGLSATAIFWPEFRSGQWQAIWFASLTLANLLMLASPWMLLRLSKRPANMTVFRYASVAAALLVSSWVVTFFFGSDKNELKVGCFVWAASFLLLAVAPLIHRHRRYKEPKWFPAAC